MALLTVNAVTVNLQERKIRGRSKSWCWKVWRGKHEVVNI